MQGRSHWKTSHSTATRWVYASRSVRCYHRETDPGAVKDRPALQVVVMQESASFCVAQPPLQSTTEHGWWTWSYHVNAESTVHKRGHVDADADTYGSSWAKNTGEGKMIRGLATMQASASEPGLVRPGVLRYLLPHLSNALRCYNGRLRCLLAPTLLREGLRGKALHHLRHNIYLTPSSVISERLAYGWGICWASLLVSCKDI